MIKGYNFIERQSPEHEPKIAGTNLTVSRVAREVELGATLEEIVNAYKAHVTLEMLREALDYAEKNPDEIREYIDESIKRSGTIIRPHE